MNKILKTIQGRHTHEDEVDKEQLEAIFSSYKDLIVEAPAGYGKTKTMVSKIAYLIVTGQVPYPKRILALTFSINASLKIRKDVIQELPSILATSTKLVQGAAQSVFTTNYHGLSRRIIEKYGYLIDKNLSNIHSLKNIAIDLYSNDAYTKSRLNINLSDWEIDLSEPEKQVLLDFTYNIVEANEIAKRPNAVKFLSENLNSYLEIIKVKFLPKGYLTFDSILLFTRKLFKEHSSVRAFYREYFPIVIVDEFQDTNILQWTLLQDLVGREGEDKNRLFIFGDRLQKIYDFIGAMEGIIDLAKAKYQIQEVKLKTNHRFKNNPTLLGFDENLRKYALNPWKPNIEKSIQIKTITSSDQVSESKNIVNQVGSILETDPNSSIAILTRAGKTNNNTNKIVEELNNQAAFRYFYALYSDEDEEYVSFHQECLKILNKESFTHLSFQGICKVIREDIGQKGTSETWASLEVLLDTFFKQINKEYKFFSVEEKIVLLSETLQTKSLKQYLMYVKNVQVTLSTIHGSKGLEWDYIILPDMEKNSFPSYPGLCRVCKFDSNCQLDWNQIKPDSEFSRLFQQELNVFYVGGTRAKKSLFFTNSVIGINSSNQPRDNNPSCFISLSGLTK